MARPSVDISTRFWAKVNKTDSCWTWNGWRDSDGYGQISMGGKHGKRIRATAAAWLIETGSLPGGYVLHRCDNPPCVRFDHLFVGTQSDNCRDAVNKGRHARSRLTRSQVDDIRRRAAGGEVQRRIAEEYGLRYDYVNKIVKGKSWR